MYARRYESRSFHPEPWLNANPGELADLWAMAQAIGYAIGFLLVAVHWLLT